MKTKLPFVFLFAFGIMLASPLTETTKIVQGQVVKVTPDCPETESGIPPPGCSNGGSPPSNPQPPPEEEGDDGGTSACCGNNKVEINGTCYSCFYLAFQATAGLASSGFNWFALGAGFVTYVACRLAC